MSGVDGASDAGDGGGADGANSAGDASRLQRAAAAARGLWADAVRHLRTTARAQAVAVGGLVVAQAACLLVALFAVAFAQVDPSIPRPDRVVMLDFKGNPPGEPSPWFLAVPVAFGPLLKARHAPLDLVTRVAFDGMEFRTGGGRTPALLVLADPDYAPLMGQQALAGDARATLESHDGIAITPDLLQKLWGDLPPAQALGRRVQAADDRWYTVGAVIPHLDPRHPHFGASPLVGGAMVLAGFDSQANTLPEQDRTWIYRMNGRVLARLRPGTDAGQVGGWMRDAFVNSPRYGELPIEWRAGREAAFFRGVPLPQLPFEGETRVLRWRVLGAVAGASALLLLMAALNTANLRAADLLQRQRETALRRSLGASDAMLAASWAAESALPLLLGACGALLLAWWVAPAVANWMGLSPDLPVADPPPWRPVAALFALTCALLPLTLAIPAWRALRRAPAAALQGRTASEGPWGRRVRQGLLALQLAGALGLLSLAGVLATQQHHLLTTDRGLDTHGRLVLGMETNPDLMPDLSALGTELSRDPAIAHWAFSYQSPVLDTSGQRELEASADGHRAAVRVSVVAPSFFDTWGMTVLAGRPRTAAGEQAVVIDEKAARGLGFASPGAAVGALVRGGGGFMQAGNDVRRVVAVVKAMSMESARDPVQAQLFLLTDRSQWNLAATGPDPVALQRAVSLAWAAHGLKVPVEIQWADDQRADLYRQEDRLTTTVSVVALLAVAVAMLGAYALVADTLRRRRTELVLHRLHGAGDAAIAAQVAREFGTPLLVAAAVALPLAAWGGIAYLDGFEDRAGRAGGLVAPLVAATLLTALVTLLATWRHVRQALALAPIEALR